MRGRLGCWSVVLVTGLAAAFPTLYFLIHSAVRSLTRSAGEPQPPRPPHRAPACLEAWVRLRSYRGCPVLAAAGGYRLEIYCSPAGWSNGALVFAGPFPGRAYLSERPVPLGRWAHLAGLEGSSALPETPARPATAAMPARPAMAAMPAWPAAPGMPARPPLPPLPSLPSLPPLSALPALPATIAIDGSDVTAGRLFGQGDPLPLGYDPWGTRARGASGGAARGDGAARRGMPRLPDGEIGAWRLSRGWRTLSQVAAARGTRWRLAQLLPPAAPRAPAPRPPGCITRRGWTLLASGLLLALAMVGAGLVSGPRRAGRAAPRERALERPGESALARPGEIGSPGRWRPGR